MFTSLDVVGSQLGAYTNWAPNRPSAETNMCVALASQYSWKWTDDNCEIANIFICETGLVCHLL